MIYFPFLEKIAEWVKSQGGWAYWLWLLSVGVIGATCLTIWLENGFGEARIPLGIFIFHWLVGGLIVGHFEKKKQNKEQPK